MKHIPLLLLLATLFVLPAMALESEGEGHEIRAREPAGEGREPVLELEWESLIPAEFQPEKLLEEYDLDNLADDAPRAAELMRKMEELWAKAPVVESLDGSRVKLPGFVVPLEAEGTAVTRFLLVPYYGACIHVPPPPSNQIVLVDARRDGAKVRELFDTVWVTGRLHVERFESGLGQAGYRLEAERVEPYE